MNQDQILILLYIGAWCVTFMVHWRKRRVFDAGCFIISTYILYAISSYMLYESSYVYFDPLPLTLFPFIYLFIMMLVGVLPILKIDTVRGIPIQTPSMKILNVVSFIFIISTLIHFPTDLSNMMDGILKMVVSSSAGQEMYAESIGDVESSGIEIRNLSAVISNAFTQVGFLLAIYYLTLPKRNKWILIGLLFSCLLKMTSGIALGQRGGIVEPILVLVATYFLLQKYIQESFRKAISIVGITFIGLLSIPLLWITLSRFDNSVTDPMESTYYYLGIENINFNNYALDAGGIRYGDRTIPLFKRMLGFDDVPRNFLERRLKYPKLKISDDTFSTYVGDFVIDFGPILATIIICFFSFLIARSTKPPKKVYHFHQFLLIHFLLYMVVLGGVKLFTYSDTGGNLKIIVFLILYTILKQKSKNKISLNLG